MEPGDGESRVGLSEGIWADRKLSGVSGSGLGLDSCLGKTSDLPGAQFSFVVLSILKRYPCAQREKGDPSSPGRLGPSLPSGWDWSQQVMGVTGAHLCSLVGI